jgi:hypothetical protein
VWSVRRIIAAYGEGGAGGPAGSSQGCPFARRGAAGALWPLASRGGGLAAAAARCNPPQQRCAIEHARVNGLAEEGANTGGGCTRHLPGGLRDLEPADAKRFKLRDDSRRVLGGKVVVVRRLECLYQLLSQGSARLSGVERGKGSKGGACVEWLPNIGRYSTAIAQQSVWSVKNLRHVSRIAAMLKCHRSASFSHSVLICYLIRRRHVSFSRFALRRVIVHGDDLNHCGNPDREKASVARGVWGKGGWGLHQSVKGGGGARHLC